MKVSSTLSIFLLVASFSTNVIAQQTNGNDDPEPTRNTQVSNTNNPPPPNTNTGRPPAQTSAPPSNEEEEDPSPSPRPSNTRPSNGDDEEEDPTERPPPRTSASNPVITPTGRPSEDEDSPNLSEPGATISSNPTQTDGGELPPPKYTPPDNGRYAIPDYPPPSVPNTKNAPYMQKSDLPEGTVFIAVGAALGLIGLIAFAWRMIVAWQLRRSIRRANEATTTESKAGLLGRYNAPSGNPKKNFYSAAAAGSSVSLDHLGSSRTGLGHSTPNTSLFFSPTMQTGSPVHQNRGSAYLPAGYYAPAASPGMGFNQSRDSLPRPRPATRDSPAHGTPPASPLLTPQARRASPGQGHHHGASVSSRTSVAQGRTPSTYLEDMLDVPFPEGGDPAAGTSEQAKRKSRRTSGHSYTGYGGGGSRR